MGDCAGPHRLRVGLQGHGPGADDRRPRRRHARRAPREPPPRADDDPLARAAAAGGDGRHRVGAAPRPAGRDASTYRFALPDAGTFWYHSHANETVQIERGLYGALVVLGPDEPVFDADRVLVLDDVKLDRHGSIAKTGALRSAQRARRATCSLINGRSEPELRDRRGAGRALAHRQRLQRALRAAVARRPALPHHRRRRRAARRRRSRSTETLLTPGDRVELAVGPFDDEGAEIAIESLPYRRTSMKRPRRDRWGTLRVGPRAPSVASIPATLRDDRAARAGGTDHADARPCASARA